MSRLPPGHPFSTHEPDAADPLFITPERVSYLAVAALVLGLLSCVPGFGILAVLIGAFGILAISRADGRLSGRGMAVVGVVLGLLTTVVWIAVGVGAVSMFRFVRDDVMRPTAGFVADAQAKSFAKLKASLPAAAPEVVTDENLARFGDELANALGNPTPIPDRFDDMLRYFGEAQKFTDAMQRGGGGGSTSLQIPIRFDKGLALVTIHFDTQKLKDTKGAKGFAVFAARDVEVTAPDGTIIRLVPQKPLPPPSATTTQDAAPDSPPTPALPPPQ